MKKVYTILFSSISIAASALNPNHFTVTLVSAPYFVVDGNSPTTITSAYVGFEVKNNSNSATTYSNLKFTVTSINTSVIGQNYALVSPANGIINVGTLAPGETRVCYFYVSYPASTTPQATFNVQLSDNTASSKTSNFNIRNRSSISANAGGTATQTFTNQDLIGGLIYDDVTYAVGNVQNGDESDFQVAVSSQFDPTKVLLLGTQVTASSVPGIPVGTTDSLYFITGNGTNGATITIRWTFRISATNFTTYLLPCAGATSGSTNYKYALNTALGQGTPITVSSAANPLTITKTADKSIYGPNANAVFTVTISNPGIYGVTIDKITDEIPLGFSFSSINASSQVTSTNSTALPATGATGTISFEGGVTSGGNNSYYVPAGGSLVLKYNAAGPALPASSLLTTARDYVGTTMVGSATNLVSVSLTLPVTLISFSGAWVGEDIHLYWKTSSEVNSSQFIVEKAVGAADFSGIGHLSSAGYSSSVTSYEFTDPSAGSGQLRYRIKMEDRDGRFTYSPVLLFTRKQTPSYDIESVYPVPCTDHLDIRYHTTLAGKVVFQLVDIAGRCRLSRIANTVSGTNYFFLDGLQTITPGTYVLRMSSNEGSCQQMFIKK